MQPIIDEKKCVKCGSSVLEEQSFCSQCGKKIKKTKKQKSKKAIKTILAILVILIIIFGLLGGVATYVYIQRSYDLATTYESLGPLSSKVYAYTTKSTDGDILSDVFYLDENYYIRMVALGDTIYISEKGVYEKDSNKLMTQDIKGNKTEYLIYKGCLIEKNCVYTGDVPAKNVFSAELKKEYLESNETIVFHNDQTYNETNQAGTFTGKYTRDGCVIEAVADNINGSHKWVVCEGKLIDRFFITNDTHRPHEARAQYEFYKYLRDVAPEKVSANERYWYISKYEEEHPISIK